MAFPTGSAHIRHYVVSDDSVPRLFDAYYQPSSPPSDAAAFDYAAEMALAAQTSMAGAMGDWLAGDSHYLGCTAHVHLGGTAAVGQQLSVTGAVGELEGDTCPDYVSAVARRYTIGIGPSYRGRVFIPCVAEINTDTSRLNTAGKAALQGIIDSLSTSIDTPGGEFGDPVQWDDAHWNQKHGLVIPVIKWLLVDTLVTQRRRRLRPLQ